MLSARPGATTVICALGVLAVSPPCGGVLCVRGCRHLLAVEGEAGAFKNAKLRSRGSILVLIGSLCDVDGTPLSMAELSGAAVDVPFLLDCDLVRRMMLF